MVHRQLAERWDELVPRAGVASAHQLWEYLTTQPDRPSPYGCVSPWRGQKKGQTQTWHYEVSGAGRVDFQIDAAHVATPGRPPHPTVFIVGISYSSH